MRKLLTLLLLCPSLLLADSQRAAIVANRYNESWCQQRISSLLPSADLNNARASTFTTDAQRRISAWNDSSGNARHFVNATDAQKPLLTRADNRENRVISSEDITPATWGQVRSVKLSATELKEDGTASNNHYILHSVTQGVVGQNYNVAISLKRGTGTRNARFAIDELSGGKVAIATINLADGTIDTTGSTLTWAVAPAAAADPADATYYRITGTLTASVATTLRMWVYLIDGTSVSYNGDNASSIHMIRSQLQSALADPTYTPTTDHMQLRGVNGRQAAWFDGVDDGLASTVTLGDLLGAGAKTLFFVTRPEATINSWIFGDTDEFFLFRRLNDGKYYTRNFDTNSDALTWATAAANNSVLIHAITHDGATLTFSQGGATPISIASGNTGSMVRTTRLGGTIGGYTNFHGPMTRIITFPRVLPDTDIYDVNKCLGAEYGGF